MTDFDLDTIRSAAEGAINAESTQTVDVVLPSALLAFFATMDPQTTLSLLERLERAEKLLSFYQAAMEEPDEEMRPDFIEDAWESHRAFLAPSTSEANSE